MNDKLAKWSAHSFEDVYLLGAGASMAYGFPTGNELKRQIIELEVKKDSIFYKIIKNKKNINENDLQNELGDLEVELANFFKSFKESSANTIDSFVARNNEYAALARIIVGFLLLESSRGANYIVDELSFEEDANELSPKHWISSYLNKRIGLDYRNYLKKPDCFISFNYDLLLESRFERYLAYQTIDSDLKNRATSIVYDELPIFHIYGKLDRYSLMTMTNALDRNEVPNLIDLLSASQGIKFIDREEVAWYGSLRDIITKAKRLIILGYGYDVENNKIIFGSSSHFSDRLKNVLIHSTSIGLSDGEVKRLVDLKNRAAIVKNKKVKCAPLNLKKVDCKNLLLEEILIRKFFHDE